MFWKYLNGDDLQTRRRLGQGNFLKHSANAWSHSQSLLAQDPGPPNSLWSIAEKIEVNILFESCGAPHHCFKYLYNGLLVSIQLDNISNEPLNDLIFIEIVGNGCLVVTVS